MLLNNAKERHIHAELNPRAPEESRLPREAYLSSLREHQAHDAWHFRLTGDPEGSVKPPYGKEWDREYNPVPYPEAKPDPEEYMGTGIAAIYGWESEEYWQLAGWNITNKNAEVRKRRKW